MNFLDLFRNFPLMCAVAAWLLAQFIKICTGIFKLQKFTFTTMMFGTGGMPSSHSAAVISLAVACALTPGLGFISTEFAIAGLLAMIVIRDATGVRREVGEHSKLLNRIMADLVESKNIDEFDTHFKELVGHTGMQVFVGALVGAATPFLMALIPTFGIWA